MDLIPFKVKNDIIAISSFLADTFHSGRVTNLLAICEDEELSICLDDYKNYFDGMLVWDSNKFFIHLNIAKGNTLESKRGRFSLAHELGHFFIDAHRIGIQTGQIPPHPSHSFLIHSDQMEKEADYFAASLLMPVDKLRSLTSRRKFSLDILNEVSNEFQVSITSAAIRFADVGTHGIMIIFSESGLVKWIHKSPDFIKLGLRCRIGSKVPPTSVIGESFLKRNAKYTGVEKVDLEDWFFLGQWPVNWQLYEQCFYSDIYNYAISLVWFN